MERAAEGDLGKYIKENGALGKLSVSAIGDIECSTRGRF